MWYDLTFALRRLARAPGFSLMTIVSLALSIGLATYITGVLHVLCFSSLPWPDADRLAAMSWVENGISEIDIDYEQYAAFVKYQKSFDALYLVSFQNAPFRGGVLPYSKTISLALVDAGTWRLHGTRPILGRVLTAADEAPDAPPTALIGETLWRDNYGADPAVLGKTAFIDGRAATIVGVMPADFKFPLSSEAWVPARAADLIHIMPVGVLKRGVSFSDAQADLDRIDRRLNQSRYYGIKNAHVMVTSFWRVSFAEGAMVVYVMLGIVCVLMLLMAWANVGNLLLARAVGHRQEVAVQAALGASGRHLMRQLLCEGLVLAGVAGTIGIFLAAWALDATSALSHPMLIQLPYWWHFGLSGTDIAAALGLMALSALVIQFLPLWLIARTDLMALLRDGSGQARSRVAARLGRGLTIFQIALCAMLLSYAGIIQFTYSSSEHADQGFRKHGFAMMRLEVHTPRYPDPVSRRPLWASLDAGLKALPGHPRYALTSQIPGAAWHTIAKFEPEGYKGTGGKEPMLNLEAVGPNFFETMEIPIVEGRALNESDGPGAPKVAVVDAALAQRYWPNQPAVGKVVKLFGTVPYTVVGVARHITDDAPLRDPADEVPDFYGLISRTAPAEVELAVDSQGDMAGTLERLRGMVGRTDPDLAIAALGSYEGLMTEEMGIGGQSLWFGVVAAVTLVLFSVGMYATHARDIAAGTRDIGIRRAVGVNDAVVLGQLLRRGAWQLAIGLPVGLGVSLPYVIFSEQSRFATPTILTVAGLTTALVMSAVVLLSILMPARRAIARAPAFALRYA